jgi:uncharacterized protein (DUF433 family)
VDECYAANADRLRPEDYDGQANHRGGTRVTVELILEKLATGESVEPILSEHPRLAEEGIRAAIAFAAEVLRADVVYPVETIAE